MQSVYIQKHTAEGFPAPLREVVEILLIPVSAVQPRHEIRLTEYLPLPLEIQTLDLDPGEIRAGNQAYHPEKQRLGDIRHQNIPCIESRCTENKHRSASADIHADPNRPVGEKHRQSQNESDILHRHHIRIHDRTQQDTVADEDAAEQINLKIRISGFLFPPGLRQNMGKNLAEKNRHVYPEPCTGAIIKVDEDSPGNQQNEKNPGQENQIFSVFLIQSALQLPVILFRNAGSEKILHSVQHTQASSF